MKNKKEVKKSKYRAIIFDLGQVLSLGKKVSGMEGTHEMVAKKLGIDIDTYLDAIDSTYSDAIEGKISRAKAISTMAKNLETPKGKLVRIYTNAYRRHFKRNMKLYRFALRLKKEGYKIGIISDIWFVAKDVFFYQDYYKYFDCVLASCDVGSRKSGKKIFKIALNKLHTKPSETIFTDDKKWNLSSSRSLGIKSILFKNNNQFISDLKKLNVF